jgi:hypothetical protein
MEAKIETISNQTTIFSPFSREQNAPACGCGLRNKNKFCRKF